MGIMLRDSFDVLVALEQQREARGDEDDIPRLRRQALIRESEQILKSTSARIKCHQGQAHLIAHDNGPSSRGVRP
jgi:hypothetical protein